MHPSVHRLGFKGSEAELADSFLRSIRHRGRSEREAVQLLELYAEKFGPNSSVTWADTALAMENYAPRFGWDNDLQDAVHGWASIVSTRGPGAILPLERRQDPRAAEVRRGEIQSLMRTDPRAYWGNAQVQHELMQLCEPQDVPLIEGPRS